MADKLAIGDRVGEGENMTIVFISEAYDEFAVRPLLQPKAEPTIITFRANESVEQVNGYLKTMQVA